MAIFNVWGVFNYHYCNNCCKGSLPRFSEWTEGSLVTLALSLKSFGQFSTADHIKKSVNFLGHVFVPGRTG